MPKATAIACFITISLVTQIGIGAFELGETVVAIRDCEFKEGKVVIKKAFAGEQYSVERVDGHRLLLGGAGSAWGDDKDFLSLEAAVEHFSRLIDKNPDDWQSLCARGRAREKLGLSSTGMLDLDEAVRLNPSCETYRRRAGAWANRGIHQRALADYKEAVRLDPKSAIAFRDRAALFYKLGECEKSLAEINKSLEIEPASPYSLVCRGLTLLENDLPEKALADADAVLRLTPKYLHARALRGAALHNLDRNEEAIAEYTAILRDNPRDFQVLVDRGCTGQETKAYDKAIADFTEAIKLRPHPVASTCSAE
jgi:tetratricopeptide (TPR) repeat protein